MSEKLKFIYTKEFWSISAFINTNEFTGEQKAEEIEAFLINRFNNLSELDLVASYKFLDNYPNAEENKELLIDMCKSISIECDWEPYLENFPYTDENRPYGAGNREIIYNSLGYFFFEVDYFKEDPWKKERITPNLIRLVSFIALDLLKEFGKLIENDYVFLDTQNPIYVFVLSNRTIPVEVEWNEENILKHKLMLGNWIQLYSEYLVYSDKWFERRLKESKNLSNRLSELHYINKHSGFIYMRERNYVLYSPYIREAIITPTYKIKALLFALRAISQSLDLLLMKRYSDMFISLETIEKKSKNLRFLRIIIQPKINHLLNEIDWDPRQHYVRILNYLIDFFRLQKNEQQLEKNFKLLDNVMQEIFQEQRQEKSRSRTQTALVFLNILFGAGVFAEIINSLRISMILEELDPPSAAMHGAFAIAFTSFFLIGLFITTSYYFYGKMRSKLKGKATRKYVFQGKVTAVVLDDNENIIFVKREHPPYRGVYELPGGFIGFREDPTQAVIREVRKRTGLNVKIEKRIGTYPSDIPRGKFLNQAFKCSIIGTFRIGEGDTEVLAIPINKVKDMNLPFNHRKILENAGIF